MALVEPIKKGGRYTKKEQEERRLQVYQLHFEENKSSVMISGLLNVNRNTVNEDIKFWYGQLANKSIALDVNAKMNRQIQRMEIQRDRFFEYLEESKTLDERIRIEKIISEIDNRLSQFFTKAILKGKSNLVSTINIESIDEEEIKEFVRDLILHDKIIDSENIFDSSLKFKFIQKENCSATYAERIIKKMHEYGLYLCQKELEHDEHFDTEITPFSKKYNIKKFAELRGYFSVKEIGLLNK